jgi:hypothetical protein
MSRIADALVLRKFINQATEEALVEASAVLDQVRTELPLLWQLIEPAWESRLSRIAERGRLAA